MKKTLILAASLLVLGLALYLIYQSVRPTSSLVSNTTEDQVKEGMAEGIDTSDWEVFQSEELGFSFRYPGDVEIHIDINQNRYGLSAGFSGDSGLGNFFSITNVKLRDQIVNSPEYNYSNDHIRIDLDQELSSFNKVTDRMGTTIECDKQYKKKVGFIDYVLVLDCLSVESAYSRLGYLTFKDDYYISAWLDVAPLLKEDGIIDDYIGNKVESGNIERVIPNPQIGEKTGQVINLMESILSSVMFSS